MGKAARRPGVCSNLAAGLKEAKKKRRERRSKGEAAALFQNETKTCVAAELCNPAKDGDQTPKELKKRGRKAKVKDGPAAMQCELVLAKVPNLAVQGELNLAVQGELKLEVGGSGTPP